MLASMIGAAGDSAAARNQPPTMGLLDRITSRGRTYKVHVRDASGTFEGRRGDEIHSFGRSPAGLAGGTLEDAGGQTSDANVRHFQVAGIHHMPRALGDSRFDVGSRVQLRLEGGSPDDSTAVGVWDASGQLQVGYAPAALARGLVSQLRSGTALAGPVIRELRAGPPPAERIAIYVLVAPPGRIELVEH
jgi:hypothetical protein